MNLPSYYLIQNDERISQRIRLISQSGKYASFAEMPPVQVWNIEAPANTEYTDWLTLAGMQLLSDRMKHILSKYNVTALFKMIYLIGKDGSSHSYWLPHIPQPDVLSEESEYYAHDHTIKHLVLDSAKVKGQHLFSIPNVRELYTLVSMDAAESLLRRGLTGFLLKPVDMSLGEQRYE